MRLSFIVRKSTIMAVFTYFRFLNFISVTSMDSSANAQHHTESPYFNAVFRYDKMIKVFVNVCGCCFSCHCEIPHWRVREELWRNSQGTGFCISGPDRGSSRVVLCLGGTFLLPQCFEVSAQEENGYREENKHNAKGY